jgi:hypothetical protein
MIPASIVSPIGLFHLLESFSNSFNQILGIKTALLLPQRLEHDE